MHCKNCKTGRLTECKTVDRNNVTYFYNHKNQLLSADTLRIDEIMVYCKNCNHVQVIKEQIFFSPKGKPTYKCKHISCSLV